MTEMTSYPLQTPSDGVARTDGAGPSDTAAAHGAASPSYGAPAPVPPSPRPSPRRPWGELGRLVAALLVGAIVGASVSVAAGRGTLAVPRIADHTTGAAATSAPASNTAQIAAVKNAIEKADAEQAQAIARNDPTLMKDTATAAHYQELVKVNSDLVGAGVTGIRLLRLEWGPISVSGSSARAVAYETWRSTYKDGTVDQSRNENDYSLVLQGGSWVVSADGQPGASTQTSPGTPPSGFVPPSTARDTSSNWSGYAATGGTFTSVSATWTVPDPATGTVGADATWVGIGGVTSHDLIQAGTEATVPNASTVRFDAWIEMLPRTQRIVPLAVAPGDSVSVSIARQSGEDWLIAMKDNTSGQSYSTTVTYASTLSSAEWIEEAPSGGPRIVPLDAFGSVRVTAARATKDGRSLTIAGAGGRPVTMTNGFHQALAEPSALGQDGASFTVTRTGAAATSPVGPDRFRRGGG